MIMSKKILVIEDEANVGASIKTFLEQYDYTVTCFGEGATGLKAIRVERPDLILTDLLLPGMHGFDVCKTLKGDGELRDIPLVIMTAVYRNAIHKLEARRLGVEGFLEKPLNFSELLTTVEGLLGSFGAADGDIESELQELRDDYASRLPKKVLELEQAWEGVQRGADTARELARFHRLVHSMAGSGTSFGFKEITENAGQLESLLDMMLAGGAGTVEMRKNKVAELLDKMRHHPVVSTGLEMQRAARH
jgi:DNA-binding response OmpR family regulator